MNVQKWSFKPFSLGLITVFFLTILTRLKVYIENRSLFLDEANLARNILEKDFASLLLPLDYGQHAPPFFLSVTKAMTVIFGPGEYVLRFIPFIAGLISIFLFYRLACYFLDRHAGMLFAMALFGFSYFMMKQGTEVKQYITDVLFALLFTLYTLKHHHLDIKKAIFLALAGAIGIWFSMPLVFVLSGIGIYYLYVSWKDDRSFMPSLIMILVWLTSFVILFYSNLKHSLASPELHNFHGGYFLTFPHDKASLIQFYETITGMFRSIVGKTAIPLAFAISTFILGTYKLIRQDFGKALIIILPILSCLLASMLHKYSLIPRLILFLFANIILIIGIGASALFSYTKTFKKYLVISLILICMILCVNGKNALKYLYKPYHLEEMRPLLEELSETLDDSPIYVNHDGLPAFKYYNELSAAPFKFQNTVLYGHWQDDLVKLSAEWKQKEISHIWVVYSHTFGENLQKLLSDINVIGDIQKEIEYIGAGAYLVNLKNR